MAEIDWRDHLMMRNASLFLKELGRRAYWPGRPDVGDGWRELIELAIDRVRRAATGQKILISRISSTSGSARMSWEGPMSISHEIAREIERAIALARARSLCTCEICGSTGSQWRRGERLGTYCQRHGAGIPEPNLPGFQNLHLSFVFDAGRPATISFQRYHRESDRFLDVDPFPKVVVARRQSETSSFARQGGRSYRAELSQHPQVGAKR
jgi:hypothetical protein